MDLIQGTHWGTQGREAEINDQSRVASVMNNPRVQAAFDNALRTWRLKFIANAKADGSTILREHLASLGLPPHPKKLMDGTLLGVLACCIYAQMANDRRLIVRQFLGNQEYDPAHAPDARYAVTFSIWDKGYARILTGKKLETLDLADLHGFGWPTYDVCGYDRFWVTRTDGKDITTRESTELQKAITNDLRYDYTEEELTFYFDDETQPGALICHVQDMA